MTTIKEPIHIRRKKIKNGNISLYLDCYYQGVRHYEFLRLYLIPENCRADKERNRQTLELANAIKAKRIVEVQNETYGFYNLSQSRISFFDYFDAICGTKKGNTALSWICTRNHLKIYEKRDNITFQNITSEWVRGFRNYLDTRAMTLNQSANHKCRPLSQNTKAIYLSKLKACLHRAYKDGLLQNDICKNVDCFSEERSRRNYLTIEELQKLSNTPCKNQSLRDRFLFSCLTGLRRCDIDRLTWGEISTQSGFTRITFKQKKTKELEYLDITPQAAELLGERGRPHEYIFINSYYNTSDNHNLRVWTGAAGIDKKITFHSARHTFAVMMLDLGTDIYTVSKLLGHSNIKTTQIYAKILDKNKQAAIANIPKIL